MKEGLLIIGNKDMDLREYRKPILGDFSTIGSLVQDSDVITYLYKNNKINLDVVKNRYGSFSTVLVLT